MRTQEEALRAIPPGKRYLSEAEQVRAAGAAGPPARADRESMLRAGVQQVGEELLEPEVVDVGAVAALLRRDLCDLTADPRLAPSAARPDETGGATDSEERGRKMDLHQRVNSFLAEWVSAVNALVAVGLPLVMGLIVGSVSDGLFGFVGGFLAGAVGGVLVAGVVCGLLAVLIDIRNSLANR